jgi:hypothetical protein
MQLSKDFIRDGDTRLLTTMHSREDENPHKYDTRRINTA